MSYGQFRPQIYKIARELQKNIFTWLYDGISCK